MHLPESGPGARPHAQEARTHRDGPLTRVEPDLEGAVRALDQALAAMPLSVAAETQGELKLEYAAMLLYVLHTRERLDVLRARWPQPPAPAANVPA